MNEQELFLKELEKDETTDPFEAPLEVTESKEEVKDEDDPEEQPESVKDRRHRRLESKLQAEREANIILNERLKAVAEAKKDVSESSDYLKTVERIYGTESPEALAATELLKKAFQDVKEDAKRELRAELQEERQREQEAVKREESELDSMVDELEDTYNIDLTSQKSDTTRKGFFKMLEKMSPKDSEGNVIAYADPHAVWEIYQSRIQKPDNRAKDLASRSMVQSGASADSKLQDDATVRFLKENDLI